MTLTRTLTGTATTGPGTTTGGSGTNADGGSWIEGFLQHPDAPLTAVTRLAVDAARQWGLVAALALLALTAGVVLGRRARRRAHLARWWADARLVTITPPPEVEPGGGAAFWGNLVGLIRPPRRRLFEGQPHVAFEYVWTSIGAQIQVWVPGVIPPGLIERAAEAAWPGAHTSTQPATRLPDTMHGPNESDGRGELGGTFDGELVGARVPAPLPLGGLATGGTLRLARTEVLPLATEHDADPLRAVFGAAVGLGPSEYACVQILARPVTGRRLRRARRAMQHLRAGQPSKPMARLLDLLTPRSAPTGSHGAASRTPRAPADPELSAQVRAAVTKAAEPAWECLIRYALTTTQTTQTADPGEITRAAMERLSRREMREVRRALLGPLRGRAHALASAYALYSWRNFLTRRHLRHPDQVVAWRGMTSGDLLSVSELAALAHLPLDATIPGLARAGARAVAPPPGIATGPRAYNTPATPEPTNHATDDPGTAADSGDPIPDASGEAAGRPGREAALPVLLPVPDAPADLDEDDSSRSSSLPATAGPSTAGIANSGSADPGGAQVKVLGDTDVGHHRPVGVTVADARHHLHVIGATGSGKSTLMIHAVLADIRAGRGVLVIDPKGDLVLDLLDRIPAKAANRLVLIDPDDPTKPPCLNPLDLAPGADMDTVVDHLVGIFRRIFSGFWGPRTDDILRAASLTLLRAANPGPNVGGGSLGSVSPWAAVPTLVDIPRLLDDATFRSRLTAGIEDEVLAGFWGWYDRLADGPRATIIAPALNKLRAFLLRSFVRDAIAAGPATLDMTRVLDGGIGLVRLPKGVLGEETSRLLGSFVVARAWQTASARARAGTPRIDAGLYMDEAQNFLNLPYPIEDMLAEARGYRLSMVLAHQNLAQLPKELKEGISANARNKIFFNSPPEDARDLERHTSPTLRAHDLSHLGAFQAAARLVVNSGDTPAFTLRTRPLPEAVPGRAAHLRAVASSRRTGPTSASNATGATGLTGAAATRRAPTGRGTGSDPRRPVGARQRPDARTGPPPITTASETAASQTARSDATPSDITPRAPSGANRSEGTGERS